MGYLYYKEYLLFLTKKCAISLAPKHNALEIYIDKTVLNLFCTKKNIKGIMERTNIIDIKISFSINGSKSLAISVLKINLSYKKTTNIQNINAIIAAIAEKKIISPNLVKLLDILFLKLLSAKTIIIKNMGLTQIT